MPPQSPGHPSPGRPCPPSLRPTYIHLRPTPSCFSESLLILYLSQPIIPYTPPTSSAPPLCHPSPPCVPCSSAPRPAPPPKPCNSLCVLVQVPDDHPGNDEKRGGPCADPDPRPPPRRSCQCAHEPLPGPRPAEFFSKGVGGEERRIGWVVREPRCTGLGGGAGVGDTESGLTPAKQQVAAEVALF